LAALNLGAPHAIDKVVVVTGGASGIGLAIAKAVVSDGGIAIVADMNEAGGSPPPARVRSRELRPSDPQLP